MLIYPTKINKVRSVVLRDSENHQEKNTSFMAPSDSPVPYQVDEEKEENQQRLLEMKRNSKPYYLELWCFLGFNWIQWL